MHARGQIPWHYRSKSLSEYARCRKENFLNIFVVKLGLLSALLLPLSTLLLSDFPSLHLSADLKGLCPGLSGLKFKLTLLMYFLSLVNLSLCSLDRAMAFIPFFLNPFRVGLASVPLTLTSFPLNLTSFPLTLASLLGSLSFPSESRNVCFRSRSCRCMLWDRAKIFL